MKSIMIDAVIADIIVGEWVTNELVAGDISNQITRIRITNHQS